MITVPFSALPDPSRVWVFGLERPLSADEAARLEGRVHEFVEGWVAHGHPVVGGHELRHGRFLLVAADEEATGVSGCSIDSLYRVLKELEREMGVGLLDGSRVWYRAGGGEVVSATRPAFRKAVEAGEVGPHTVVFDNTVATLGDVREGRWERPFRDSWHARAFGAALSA